MEMRDMKDDRVYVRLSREDKEKLVELSVPYGGISNWILAHLNTLKEGDRKTGIGLIARNPATPPGFPVK
jgi:hypothetical protein